MSNDTPPKTAATLSILDKGTPSRMQAILNRVRASGPVAIADSPATPHPLSPQISQMMRTMSHHMSPAAQALMQRTQPGGDLHDSLNELHAAAGFDPDRAVANREAAIHASPAPYLYGLADLIYELQPAGARLSWVEQDMLPLDVRGPRLVQELRRLSAAVPFTPLIDAVEAALPVPGHSAGANLR